jgi:hypothetical protein
MAEKDAPGLEEAHEQGYIGEVAENPPNEAYTVQGQGADTAEAEREAIRDRRREREDATREENKAASGGSRRSAAKSSEAKASSS